MCPECYSKYKRITPLLNPRDCLNNHRQYTCSTCGRYICAAVDDNGKYRALFPFKSLKIAKLYLRAAEVIREEPCGIYEIENAKGRKSYKIFTSIDELQKYINGNQDKECTTLKPLFATKHYKKYKENQLRSISTDEVDTYLQERKIESEEWSNFI